MSLKLENYLSIVQQAGLVTDKAFTTSSSVTAASASISGAVSTATLSASGEASVVTSTALTAGGADAINIGTSDAIKILFGSGAPTASAPQDSLYLRSDGSSTSTRLYVNTNGSTTWTNVTTAA